MENNPKRMGKMGKTHLFWPAGVCGDFFRWNILPALFGSATLFSRFWSIATLRIDFESHDMHFQPKNPSIPRDVYPAVLSWDAETPWHDVGLGRFRPGSPSQYKLSWILLYKWARTMCLVPITSKYHGTSFFLCTSSLFFWNTFFFVKKNHWAPFEFVFSNAPKKTNNKKATSSTFPRSLPRKLHGFGARQDGSQPASPIPIATLPKAKAGWRRQRKHTREGWGR